MAASAWGFFLALPAGDAGFRTAACFVAAAAAAIFARFRLGAGFAPSARRALGFPLALLPLVRLLAGGRAGARRWWGPLPCRRGRSSVRAGRRAPARPAAARRGGAGPRRIGAAATVLAAFASAARLAILAAEDPKRRRAHGLPAAAPPRRRADALALALVAVPGLGLALLGDAAGFPRWLGAVSVAGWAVAATPPARAKAAVSAPSAWLAAARARAERRLAALEARIAALEPERDERRRPATRLALRE